MVKKITALYFIVLGVYDMVVISSAFGVKLGTLRGFVGRDTIALIVQPCDKTMIN